MKRQVFYSFHYERDNWRVQQVINMGVVEGSKILSSNDWEEVKKKGDDSIKKWIDGELEYRSCVIVLIGQETYSRKWIKYEIEQAHKNGKGLLGIYIHNLKDRYGKTDIKGINPFTYNFTWGYKVKVFDPNSYDTYNDIKNNIEDLVEKAINDII